MGMPLERLHDLTPRQIHDIYLPPRDEKGVIKVPKSAQGAVPSDPRATLLRLLGAAPTLGLKSGEVEKIKKRLAEMDNGKPTGPS